MKKIAFALSALAAVTTANTAVAAADGTVEIRGRVVDQTCEVVTAYKNLVVVLDTVGKNALSARGETAAQKPFHIEVENCGTAALDGLTRVYAAFSTPSPDDIDTANAGTLKNRANSGNATNVNIQLLNSNGLPIDLNPFEEGKSATPVTTKNYTAQSPEVQYGVKKNYNKATGERTAADQTTASTDILGKKIVGGETEFRSQADGNNPNLGVELTQGNQKFQLKYGAQYYATNAATAGIVEAFVTYNIAYK